MSDQSKDEAAAAAGSAGPLSEASPPVHDPASGGVRPTEQLPRTSRPNLGKDVPRTDDELGLDPGEEVPAAGTSGATGAGAGAAGAGAGDAPTAVQPPGETYSYASIPPATNAPTGNNRLRARNGDTRRGTLDLGLFLLRLVVGGTFLYHGLQKLAGWFDGPGLDGTRQSLEEGGWDHPSLATAMLVAGEVGGGALLILGLATPLAAGAVLAVILNAWFLKQSMEPGFQYSMGQNAVELDTILAGTAAALILTGPGRWSFDRSRGWATRPYGGSFVVLLLAIAAAVATWWWLHGGNPLTGIGPFN